MSGSPSSAKEYQPTIFDKLRELRKRLSLEVHPNPPAEDKVLYKMLYAFAFVPTDLQTLLVPPRKVGL